MKGWVADEAAFEASIRIGRVSAIGALGRDQYGPIVWQEVRQGPELPDKFPISAGGGEGERRRRGEDARRPIGLNSRSPDPDRHLAHPRPTFLPTHRHLRPNLPTHKNSTHNFLTPILSVVIHY